MNYKTRGKIYSVVGLGLILVAIWYEYTVIGIAGGLIFGWSYWMWWRDLWLQIWNKKAQK